MPEIFRRYFTAAYHADPFGEDVGIYSNVQIAYAWYFTRDPRHLGAAIKELDSLLPDAEPLQRPEDLGKRIYNPLSPIKALAAVPRLIAVLADAERAGVRPAIPPLAPQRTIVALRRDSKQALRATLWGWDRNAHFTDAEGQELPQTKAREKYHSHLQPFDRTMPNYEVYECSLTSAPQPGEGWCFLNPTLETGIVSLTGAEVAACWAGDPVRVEPGQRWWWRIPAASQQLVLESALAAPWKVSLDGKEVSAKVGPNNVTVSLGEQSAGKWLTIEHQHPQLLWFRIAGVPGEQLWVMPRRREDGLQPPMPAVRPQVASLAADSPPPTYVPGKFGKALLIVPGRELQIPDEFVDSSGNSQRLSNQRQGTIEFWIQRWWDDRVAKFERLQPLANGSLQVVCPDRLPLGDWAHVAVVWYPSPNDPHETLMHTYVDGVDYGRYRSLHWEGYSRPLSVTTTHDWLKAFTLRTGRGMKYAIDELRISTVPRYSDPKLNLGRQQTFNSYTFTPPSRTAEVDRETVFKISFDGSCEPETPQGWHLETKLIGTVRPIAAPKEGG